MTLQFGINSVWNQKLRDTIKQKVTSSYVSNILTGTLFAFEYLGFNKFKIKSAIVLLPMY